MIPLSKPTYDMASIQLSKEIKYTFTLFVISIFFIIWDQIHWWKTIAEYSFGYTVPLLAGYILWERWPQIKAILHGKDLTLSTQKTVSFWTRQERKHSAFVPTLEITALLATGVSLFIFLGSVLARATQGPRVGASLALAISFGFCALAGIFLGCVNNKLA